MASWIKTPTTKQKSAKDYLLEFQSQTGIKAFAFLKAAVCPLERFLWGIVLAVTIALTINDITRTVMKYMGEPTVTNVQVMRNHSFTLPDPVLCIQYDSETMENSIDIENEESLVALLKTFEDHSDILDHFHHQLSRMQNLSKAQDFNDPFFRVSPPLHFLLPDKNFWNLLFVTQRLLAYLVKQENIVSGDRYNDELVINNLRKIYDFYQKRKVSFEHLWKSVGAVMCQMTDLTIIKIRHDRHNGTLTHHLNLPCVPDQITWLGGSPFDNTDIEKICVTLGGDSFYYKIRDDHNIISMKPQRLLSATGLNANARRRLKTSINFAADRVTTSLSQNLLEIHAGQQHIATTTLLGHYKSLNTKNHKCSAKEKYLDCRSVCRAEYMGKNCGCWPLSWVNLVPKHQQSEHLCPDVNYANREDRQFHYFGYQKNSAECEKSFNSYDPDLECYKNCHEGCEQWIFNFRYDQFIEPIGDENVTMIDLYVDPFSFPYFEVQLAMDGRALLAALGGNLSFWIGASLLALIHIVVFILRMPFDCYSARLHKIAASQSKDHLELEAKNEGKPNLHIT